MKFVVLLILSSVVLTLSLPGKQRYAAIENVYGTDIISDEVTEEHTIFKKSINPRSSNFENEVSDGTVQEPCRQSLPTLVLPAAEIQDPYRDDEVRDYTPQGLMPPRIPSYPYIRPYDKWTPYDFDYLPQEPVQDFRSSYNSYDMPYAYFNPVPSVRSLPPVISTHIHETIQEMPELNDGYGINVFPDNDMYFPPYVRSVRSRDEDFLEQLEKDAVIPNVLPTMPFPYMRTAYPPKYAQYNPSYQTHQNGAMALFPPGSESDCDLPFILNCTPKISHGTPTYTYG